MNSPFHHAPLPEKRVSVDFERLRAAASTVRRILVVDDDADVRRLLETVLRRAGYVVSCAGDGEEGWDALCSEKYDALITDLEMPRLTGLGLLRRVRAGLLSLPVILVSGRMPWGESELGQLLTPGFALAKPLSIPVLLAKVSGFLKPA